MKKLYLLFLISTFSFSQYVSIEQIKGKKDTIESLDLSFKQLKEIPDLSKYTIKELDLSSNYIDSLNFRYLPKGLEKLNLSDNYLKGKIILLKKNDKLNKLAVLKKINLSHNKIKKLKINYSKITEIDISYNDLDYVYIGLMEDINYLNISNNKNLDPTLSKINYIKIKKFIKEKLKNDKPFTIMLLTEDIPQKGKIVQ